MGMTISADVNFPIEHGKASYGVRNIFEVSGGWVEGPHIKGTLVGPSADWMVVDDAGYATLDIRTSIKTNDEDPAYIYLSYKGKALLTPATLALLGDDTAPVSNFGDLHFNTAIFFETGDPRYAYLNGFLALGEGRVYKPTGTSYFIVQQSVSVPSKMMERIPAAKQEL